MTPITVETLVKAKPEVVWNSWTDPLHITQWCYASDDWHVPNATNDLRTGGKFSTTMAAKDGSFSFEFGGDYTLIEPMNRIEYVMSDGRKVQVVFKSENGSTRVTETFDPENQNPPEMQQQGWQAILDNFARYTEGLSV